MLGSKRCFCKVSPKLSSQYCYFRPAAIWKLTSTRTSRRRCSVKKLFLEILQNSQENTCARVSFLKKLQPLVCNFIKKKRLWHRCFPVNFAKFLKHVFLQNTSSGCFWNNHSYYSFLDYALISVIELLKTHKKDNFQNGRMAQIGWFN